MDFMAQAGVGRGSDFSMANGIADSDAAENKARQGMSCVVFIIGYYFAAGL